MNNTNYKIALQSKQWLINALFELMKSHPYESITISQICRKADLSRRTFYRLFSSKNDLLKTYVDLLTNDYLSLLPNDRLLSYLDMASTYFTFWYQHKYDLIILKKANLLSILFFELQVNLPKICSTLSMANTEICRIDCLPYVNAFGFGGLNNMLIQWVDDDMSATPETLLEYLVLFLKSIS